MEHEPSSATGSQGLSYGDLVSDRVLVVVLLVSVSGSLGTNIAAPAIPAIASAFEVSGSRAGLVITTFSLTSMFAVPVTSVLADLYGRRVIVIPGVLGFGLAGAAVAWAWSFDVVLLLRAIQGIAFAGTAPLVVVLIGDRYEGPAGSAAQGMRASAHGISSIVSPALAGLVAGILWRYPFLLYAACVPVAALAYWYLPRHEPVADMADPATDVLAVFREYAQALRVEITRPGLLILLLGGVSMYLVRIAVVTFVPLFVVDQLASSFFVAGLMLSIRGVVRILVAPTVGALTARASRRTVLVSSFGVCTVGAGLVGMAGSVPVLGAVIALYSIGLSICLPLLNDAVVSTTRDEYRAGVIGGFSMLKNGAISVSPVLFGAVLAASSYRVMYLVVGVVAAAYTLALFAFYRPKGDVTG